MAKYTSDGSLIQGAATAYKNYDNAPGMYAGLDKAIKAGTDTMNTAVENKRVADAKALKKKEEEEKRAKQLNNAFYEMSAPIHEAAGGFDEVTGKYASVAAKLEELQPRYIDVMQNGTATEKAKVQQDYNNIKNDVSLNVEYRASVADPENGISVAAMGIGDGRDLEFVTKYLDSKLSADPKPNEKGEETYTIDINGTPMTKTFAEINAMTIFSDQKVFNDVLGATTKLGNSLKGTKLNEYTRRDFETKIQTMLPDEENAMLAFMNDKGFGDEGFIDLISKSNNRASIEEEIMSIEKFNTDGGGISQPEWENFTNAMANPYNDTWKKADGTHDKKAWFEMSRQIVTEQMANGAENQHALNNPEDPQWKKEGYANKGAYLKAVKAAQAFTPDTETEVGVDGEGNAITDPNDPNYVATMPTSSSVFDLINVGNDDDASENLNKKLGLEVEGQVSNRAKVAFAPAPSFDGKGGAIGTGLTDSDRFVDRIIMYNPRTGKPYRIGGQPDGEMIEFDTGDDAFIELGEGEENPTALRIIEELKKLGIDTSKFDVDAKIDVTKMSNEQMDNQIKNLKGE